ncbi:MAG TPA: homocysteine S-methyltransferase family protein, partial [Mobilitalea sp.]|nr:homocysteine S-methyltransferase family protein [Mobilitalea sp.]
MTKKEFRKLAESKIIILDGATGSNLQKEGLQPGLCPEQWMVDNKEKVIDLQLKYLEAGTDILFAPTFTSNRIKLKEYNKEEYVDYFNKELVRLSKKAVEVYRQKTGNQRQVYIAGDITMTGRMVAPHGNMPFEELINVYKEQIRVLLTAGVDLFVIETMMSLQECRAALLAVHELCDLPVMVSLTYQENNRTLYGTDPLTAVTVLQAMGADAVGVNCSVGPDKLHDMIRQMKEIAYVPVLAKPNAGIPYLKDGKTVFPMEADEFAKEMAMLVECGAGIIGGCCGTTPEHIAKTVKAVKDKKVPEIKTGHYRALATEKNTVPIDLNGRFMVVGERINPTGKKDLQASLLKGDLSLVVGMAIEQISRGADFLDINVGMGGIDEKEIMVKAVEEVAKVADVPLLIDTGSPEAMEAALRIYPGRAMINSVSLEKEKIDKILPLAKKYGAMFILLPLSDAGLPKDTEEKKRIIHEILDRAYELGLTREDIIVDGLVNTVGANPRAALDALETIRYCKNELGIGTIIGLSNISFGLPARGNINSTFLAFAIQAGLTMAIANPSQELLMNTALAADLLLGKEGAPQRYIENVRELNIQQAASGSKDADKNGIKKDNVKFQLKGDEKRNADKNADQDYASRLDEGKYEIYKAVLKGNKKDIISLVKKELDKKTLPGDIIDNILIPAINEVGRLFDSRKYFLPQLIAGAETMKLAIDYLEPMLTNESGSTKNKGTVIIATVSGDIHDIGKNLVALMLKNYGYRVIDLGKDVPTERIIHEAKKESADIIALSALMTTTMVEMENVIKKAKEEG